MKMVRTALLMALLAATATACQSGGQAYVGGDVGAHDRLR